MNKTYLLLLSFIAFNFGIAQTIADARAMSVGSTVTVTGIVTLGEDDFSSPTVYIQDATAGIAIYDFDFIDSLDFHRGDSITVIGELYDYSDLLEVKNLTSYVKLGTGTIPDPKIITPSEMIESNESMLVSIENCSTDSVGVFDDGNNYIFRDIMNVDFQVRLQTGCTADGDSISMHYQKITGVLGQYNGTYQILPRDSLDFMDGSMNIGVNEELNKNLSITFNPSNRNLQIENHSNKSWNLEVYDLSGKSLLKSSINPNTNKTLSFTGILNGIYFLNASNGAKAYTKKLIAY